MIDFELYYIFDFVKLMFKVYWCCVFLVVYVLIYFENKYFIYVLNKKESRMKKRLKI